MNSGNITIPFNPEPLFQVIDGAKKRGQARLPDVLLKGITFELTGLGGLPLVLRLSEGLDEAATRSNAAPASHGVICMVTSSILAA